MKKVSATEIAKRIASWKIWVKGRGLDPEKLSADEVRESQFNYMSFRNRKTMGNTDVNQAKKNVSDLVVFGDGDMFQLLSKASSENEGWMKSTKCMEVPGGCVIQVSTQQRNPDGSYAVAEALTFVPGVKLQSNAAGKKLAFIGSM